MSRLRQPPAPAQHPALRISYRPQRRARLTTAAQFEWYLCPQAGPFSYLVLLAAGQPLGHWVLPAVGSAPAEPTAGLWLQVAPEVGLPRPVAHTASCQGTGAALGGQAPAAATELLLHLPAAEGPQQVYWLRPLRPGSPSWLLSRERPHGRAY